MPQALYALFVTKEVINPWFAFILGAIAGMIVAIGYFKHFYVPALEGSVNRNDAARKAVYTIIQSIHSLKSAALESDQDKRRKEINDGSFYMRIVAEIQPAAKHGFIRKRIARIALRAERAAMKGNLAALDKSLAKILALIA